MNLCHLNFYSDSLKGATSVIVLLPSAPADVLAEKGFQEVYAERRVYPCLYLLHGMQGDAGSWLRLTRLEQYASLHNIAVVLPSFGNSFGFQLPCHMHYDTFLSDELPAFLRSILPLSSHPSKNYIAGLSMGGFAALHIALRYPERYAAAASFSGALEPYSLFEERGLAAAGAAMAEPDLLYNLAQKSVSADSLPRLYLTCGLQDECTLSMNRKADSFLRELDIKYTYEEWNGGHEWIFWDESLRRFLAELHP